MNLVIFNMEKPDGTIQVTPLNVQDKVMENPGAHILAAIQDFKDHADEVVSNIEDIPEEHFVKFGIRFIKGAALVEVDQGFLFDTDEDEDEE